MIQNFNIALQKAVFAFAFRLDENLNAFSILNHYKLFVSRRSARYCLNRNSLRCKCLVNFGVLLPT